MTNCCCGNCTGCCLPVDYSNPTYPNGRIVDIPFCISAPGCATLDGQCADFVGGGTATPRFGSCGICAGYLSTMSWELSAFVWAEGGSGGCNQTPCSIRLCLSLICLEGDDRAAGIEECCSRLRLLVGTTQRQADETSSSPAGPCISWKQVAPTFCECSDSPNTRPGVIFPLSLNFACDEVFVGGGCDGLIKCCQNLILCDLTGAEVVI